jgi:hypothetical protein
LLYAALAGSAGIIVAFFVSHRKTRQKFRRIERQIRSLRAQVGQLQALEARRVLDATKTTPSAVVEPDNLSSVPEEALGDLGRAITIAEPSVESPQKKERRVLTYWKRDDRMISLANVTAYSILVVLLIIFFVAGRS